MAIVYCRLARHCLEAGTGTGGWQHWRREACRRRTMLRHPIQEGGICCGGTQLTNDWFCTTQFCDPPGVIQAAYLYHHEHSKDNQHGHNSDKHSAPSLRSHTASADRAEGTCGTDDQATSQGKARQNNLTYDLCMTLCTLPFTQVRQKCVPVLVHKSPITIRSGGSITERSS